MLATLDEIYEPERGDRHEAPVVLIHDGGGTIFQYYMLGYLGRQTYGIGSPYFQSGTKPEGGIAQLAQMYVDAIVKMIKRGPIILGGWSFGGILSIEVAKILSETHMELRVLGILMIDSPCPWVTANWNSKRPAPQFRETTSEKNKELITKSFDNCRAMISEYEKPASWKPPPTAMIRAEESSMKNVDPDIEEDGIIGWSAYDDLRIDPVITVPGNHFTMFADERIELMTRKIKEVLRTF